MSSIDPINPIREYAKLIKLVEDDSRANLEDVYDKLMQKEEKALDLLTRVNNQQRLDNSSKAVFYNAPVLDIVNELISTWRIILREVTHEDQAASSIKQILWDGDRKIYVGMTVVLISLILFFIHTSK